MRKSTPEQEAIAKVVRWAIMIFFAYILFTGGLHTPAANHSQTPQSASGGKAEAGKADTAEKNCAPQDNFSSFSSLASSMMPTVVPIIHTETISPGTGESATCGQHAEVNYEYQLQSGSVIFSNYGEAPTRVTLGDGGLLRGMEMGLIGLKPGGERRVTFPYALGLGRVNDLRAVRNLDKFTMKPADLKDTILVGKVRLLSLSPTAPETSQPIRVIERKFNSGAHVACGDTVSVRLSVWKLDGTKIFSTDDDAKVLVFTVGASEVPYGLEQAIMGMGVDGERTAIIPAGYMKPLITDINWPQQPELLSFNWPKETVLAEIYLSHIGDAPVSTTAMPLPGVPAVPPAKPSLETPAPAPSSSGHAAKAEEDSDKDDEDDDAAKASGTH